MVLVYFAYSGQMDARDTANSLEYCLCWVLHYLLLVSSQYGHGLIFGGNTPSEVRAAADAPSEGRCVAPSGPGM
eukprot:11431787-Ditylum_brightwellii.AAC.1